LRCGIAALALIAVLLLTACRAGGPRALDRLQRSSPLAAAAAARLAAMQLAADDAARRRILLRSAADWYLARMSPDDRLGQLILSAFSDTWYSPDLAAIVARGHVGGIQLFGYNFSDPEHTRAMLQQAQADSPIPLLVTTDQEGGSVNRIAPYDGAFPSAWDMGSSGDPQFAYATGRRTALALDQFGVNADLAPVVDVPVDGGWVWSEQRVFSEDPSVVARYAGAFMAGLRDAGMVTCLKHFPGLGSVRSDPHTSLPVITRTLEQVRQMELAPYAALIPQVPDMIMSTDVLLPAVDPVYPAELSPAVISGVLRDQLGYDGVVVTDALWMEGISATWDLGEAAVLAVLAGDDLLMAAFDSAGVRTVLDALGAAVASGRISRARIEQSVRRILMLKLAHGLLPIPGPILARLPLAPG
jgi:beta-N-acetylhexosaminidase